MLCVSQRWYFLEYSPTALGQINVLRRLLIANADAHVVQDSAGYDRCACSLDLWQNRQNSFYRVQQGFPKRGPRAKNGPRRGWKRPLFKERKKVFFWEVSTISPFAPPPGREFARYRLWGFLEPCYISICTPPQVAGRECLKKKSGVLGLKIFDLHPPLSWVSLEREKVGFEGWAYFRFAPPPGLQFGSPRISSG